MAMASHVFTSTTCPTCGRAAHSPFRSHDAAGQIVLGCVDFFHTGHLVTPSASAEWHERPEARKIRAATRISRHGCVTVSG